MIRFADCESERAACKRDGPIVHVGARDFDNQEIERALNQREYWGVRTFISFCTGLASSRAESSWFFRDWQFSIVLIADDHHFSMRIAIIDTVNKSDCLLSYRSRGV
jgi:hypothetical protein